MSLRKSQKPVITGLLMLTSVALTVPWWLIIPRDLTKIHANPLTWALCPFPFFALASGFGGNAVVSSVLGLLLFSVIRWQLPANSPF